MKTYYLIGNDAARKMWARIIDDEVPLSMINAGWKQVTFWQFWKFRLTNWM